MHNLHVLLTSLPSEELLQRLLDGEPLPEVAREPDVFVQVIGPDGRRRDVLTSDPR